MPRLPLLTVVERGAIIDDRAYVASGIFNDVFRRQKLIHAASACLAREHGLMITNGVLRRASREFGPDDKRLYQAILPRRRERSSTAMVCAGGTACYICGTHTTATVSPA